MKYLSKPSIVAWLMPLYTLAMPVLAVLAFGTGCNEAAFELKTAARNQAADSPTLLQKSADNQGSEPGKSGDAIKEDGKDQVSDKASSDDDAQDHEGELACQRQHGQATVTKLSGDAKTDTVELKDQDFYAVHVSGDQTHLDIHIGAGAEQKRMKGLCLLVTGNQGTINVTADYGVESIYAIARGNQTQVKISVAKDAVVDAVYSHSGGGAQALSLSGDGKYPTPSPL